MSLYSNSEWCDGTLNTIRGCKKVSPGCRLCYAEPLGDRLYDGGFHHFELIWKALKEPFKWQRKYRLVFVNSMSDLFLPRVPTDFIGDVGRMMALTPWQAYQLLTKRSGHARTGDGRTELDEPTSQCLVGP
jgi:protein gp37